MVHCGFREGNNHPQIIWEIQKHCSEQIVFEPNCMNFARNKQSERSDKKNLENMWRWESDHYTHKTSESSLRNGLFFFFLIYKQKPQLS